MPISEFEITMSNSDCKKTKAGWGWGCGGESLTMVSP